MAPIGMVLGEVLSPEVGIISAAVFLVLSVIGVALCAQCQRKGGNAYDVNTVESGKPSSGANGTADTKTADTTDSSAYTSWRDHKAMPASTLERSTMERGKAYTQ